MKTTFFDDIEKLRGFACILVLIQHIAWICPLYFARSIVPDCLITGSGGVHIFFAISGFVITLSLKDKINALQGNVFLERLFSAKDLLLSFYRKRFYRIFPVVLFVAIVLGIFLNFTEKDPRWLSPLVRSLSELFFGVHNNSVDLFVSIDKIHSGGIGPLWTIAVESQFYIFWPIILLLCKNDNERAIVSLSSGLIFMLIIQPTIAALYGMQYYAIYNNVTELFLGSFLAFLYKENSSLEMSACSAKIWAAVLAMIIWTYPGSIDKTFYAKIVVSGASVLLVALLVFVKGSFDFPILGKVFNFLGSRSFSFYAIQLTLANVAVWYTNSIYFPKDSLKEGDFYCYQFIIFIIVLFIVSELMYRFIEKPSREFGRK
jgi:peptidoglycan/LPS O-acetylase OafA/YrhL